MTEEHAAEERLMAAQAALERLDDEVRKVFIGQDALVRGALMGLIAQGNLLLEGAPGLGKTLLVRTLAQALDLDFSRIQFTPDLMPADITGGPTLLRSPGGETELQFRKGPIFAHIVLADEINRGTPRTQSALLEAMQEHAVTIAGKCYTLEPPFFVLATQNPIEMEGTYPLPEAQLDRFLFKLHVPYPDKADLIRIGMETTGTDEPEVSASMDRAQLLDIQALCREIVVAPHVADLAARLTLATHPDTEGAVELVREFVQHGASPRAMQSLLLAGRAAALIDGRPFVTPEDLRNVALPVMRHRVFLGFEAGLERVTTDDVVQAVLESERD
jgi:MoxR-like ATPase